MIVLDKLGQNVFLVDLRGKNSDLGSGDEKSSERAVLTGHL